MINIAEEFIKWEEQIERLAWLDGHAAATVTYKKKYAKRIDEVNLNLNACDARKEGYDRGYLKGYAAAVNQYRNACVSKKDAFDQGYEQGKAAAAVSNKKQIKIRESKARALGYEQGKACVCVCWVTAS